MKKKMFTIYRILKSALFCSSARPRLRLMRDLRLLKQTTCKSSLVSHFEMIYTVGPPFPLRSYTTLR